MKIRTPGPGMGRGADNGETGAAEFLRNRENGNIALARKLGRDLAMALLGFHLPRRPRGLEEGNLQVRLLYSFALIQAVETGSPNSILSHTTIGSFYDCIAERDPGTYDFITDSAIFSLYLLAEEEEEASVAIGRVFARACGREGDPDFQAAGMEIYETCRLQTFDLLDRVSYC